MDLGLLVAVSNLIIVLRLQLSLLPGLRADIRLDLRPTLQIQPRADKDDSEVEEDVHPENAEVAELVAVENVERSTELVSSSVLTETALARCDCCDIAAGLLCVGAGVGVACLTRWCGEDGQLFLGTDDRLVVNDEGEHAFEKVVEWCEPVHLQNC